MFSAETDGNSREMRQTKTRRSGLRRPPYCDVYPAILTVGVKREEPLTDFEAARVNQGFGRQRVIGSMM